MKEREEYLGVLRRTFEEMNIMIRTKEDMPEQGWYDRYRFLERKRDRFIKKLNPPAMKSLLDLF